MTRKHYIAIAQILKNARETEGGPTETVDAIVWELCSVLKQDNANFDSSRFKEATHA